MQVENFLISMVPDPPCSILLVGRSGTGKTTVALQRLWAAYKSYHDRARDPLLNGGVHFHQLFVTHNNVLRDQVDFLGILWLIIMSRGLQFYRVLYKNI